MNYERKKIFYLNSNKVCIILQYNKLGEQLKTGNLLLLQEFIMQAKVVELILDIQCKNSSKHVFSYC